MTSRWQGPNRRTYRVDVGGMAGVELQLGPFANVVRAVMLKSTDEYSRGQGVYFQEMGEDEGEARDQFGDVVGRFVKLYARDWAEKL